MQVVVGETRCESSVRVGSMPADGSATHALFERTVEELDAVRGVPSAGHGIVHSMICAADREVAVVRGVLASTRRQIDVRRTTALPRGQLHHPAHRVGAVQYACRASDDLDTIELA